MSGKVENADNSGAWIAVLVLAILGIVLCLGVNLATADLDSTDRDDLQRAHVELASYVEAHADATQILATILRDVAGRVELLEEDRE